MLDAGLRIIVPYFAMFVLAYSVTWYLSKGRFVGQYIVYRRKKSVGVMDTILIIELIAIVVYVIVDFCVFWHTGAEPTALTVGFFAVCGGENGFMAWIKTRKEEERFRRWQKEDEGKEYHEDNGL